MRIRPSLASLFLALLTMSASFAAATPPASASDPTPRIVDGSEPEAGAYPFMAAVVDRHRANAWYGLLCGGAVIGSDWVVTAASCVAGKQASDLDVVTGRHDLSADGGLRVHVVEISVHPSYSPGSHRYDGALLRLAAPVPAGSLELAPPDGTYVPAAATIAGWGDTETEERFPRTLRHADVNLVTDEACGQIFGIDFDPLSMLCAGDPAVGASTCTGDRGGPLFSPEGDHWVLLGASSWGVGCDVAGFPGVFSEISASWGWIHSTTGLGTLYCDGRPATIIGTEAADFLTGTDGPDVIAGLGGSDQIDAFGGDDVVCGGAGNDRITAGDGDDTVWAGTGSDLVHGDAGDDALWGESGNDRLSGGA
ncbi:MAG: trypsin-like serine protease, partial [Acidimicrobiia bacterium]|nr:trypsin-like serine protease [Acidimicrobiia bacterium]